MGAERGQSLRFIYQTPQTTPPHTAPPAHTPPPRGPRGVYSLQLSRKGSDLGPSPQRPSQTPIRGLRRRGRLRQAGPTSPTGRAPRPSQAPTASPSTCAHPAGAASGSRRARRPHREERARSGSALTRPGGCSARGPTAAAALYGGRGPAGRTRL